MESTFGQPKYRMPPREEVEAFATFVEELDELAWARLLENIPAAIADLCNAAIH